MILGLLLDTAHCFSILTMGPTADSSEVRKISQVLLVSLTSEVLIC